jgi:hypothetical protein
MRPDKRFLNLGKEFWANVRTISQQGGYTVRRTGQIKVHSVSDMISTMQSVGLGTRHICRADGKLTELGKSLGEYFKYRSDVLSTFVEPRLMDAARAARIFNDLKSKLKPQCPLPMNKQKGEKAAPAYLTGIVNMLIEANCRGLPCDYDPRTLTTVTRDGTPLRTLARRVDGCFPSTVNPIAVWEIKEYYYTTTFGSRVADGVYETLLDGLELEELREHEGIEVQHLLMVDAHYTWWICGRSYLCRLVDMLHMGYVDEILFGYEVVERLPSLVKDWTRLYQKRLQQ